MNRFRTPVLPIAGGGIRTERDGLRMMFRKSVRSTIFRSHLALIVLMTVIFAVFFYVYTADILRKRAIASLQELASSFSRSIDSEIVKMNNISLNITNSDVLKRDFAEFGKLGGAPESPERNVGKYLTTKRITDLLFTIIGPLKPVPQVNLYDFSGGMVGAGIFSREAALDVRAKEWFPGLDLRYGSKIVTYPREDKLLDETVALYRRRLYLSLCRVFYDSTKTPLGVIEVKQFHDEIFKNFGGAEESCFVFDGPGRQLYPFPAGAAGWDGAFVAGLKPGVPVAAVRPFSREREILVAQEPRQTDWKILVTKKERTLLRPVRDFTLLIALICAITIAAAVWLASRLSLRITAPISELKEALKSLEGEGILRKRDFEIDTSLDELGELQLSFKEMHEKVGDSVRGMLEAKEREMRATFLALQSQMDPHFLFNMLSVLGIMAEEGMDRDITETIGHLTHLLRYSASGSSSFVTLPEELEYTRRYLLCMKTRFREDLRFDISVPSTLEDLVIPKLVIQPLVENCMKHATNREPPWFVGITGSAEHGLWTVSVRDNGPGFDPGSLEAMNRDLSTRGDNGEIMGLGMGGMGLRNIAARLYLHSGEGAFCRVANDEGGGARVTIGGRISHAQTI